MLTAISRYGPRVIPNTLQILGQLKKRGQLIEGPHIAAFETAFAARLGPVRAVTTSYGRMAFYYILKALDLPAGGEVVFPALTFWVMPEMARVAGLTPVFADVDPVTFNLTAATVERVVTRKTVAIVPTHLWGLPCDMNEIAGVAKRHGLPIVEDCAHALGARYRGRPVGTLGDAAIFSFQTLKPLNAYGGGMAVMRDPLLAARVGELAGAERPPALEHVQRRFWQGRVLRIATRPPIFTWTLFPLLYAGARLHWSIDMYFWERIRPLDPLPGDYRERFSNAQAAIGLEGLSMVESWNTARQRLAQRMTGRLRQIPGVMPPSVPPDRTHVFYQYCAYVPSRPEVVDACLRRGVDIETLHVDVCPDLDLFGPRRAPTPGAKETTRTIQVPIYESLTDEQLDRVADVVRDAATALPAKEPRAVPQS